MPRLLRSRYVVVIKKKSGFTSQVTSRFQYNYSSSYLSTVKLFYSKCLAQRRKARKDKEKMMVENRETKNLNAHNF